MKQLAFLIISCSPYLKNTAQNFKPLVLAESILFHHSEYMYLSRLNNIFPLHKKI